MWGLFRSQQLIVETSERGVNPKIVSEILGHSDVAITLGVYTHVTPRLHEAAIDTMDSLLD